MKPIHRAAITVMALLLAVASVTTAHHVYETHLSSGYASILQTALTSSYGERTAYIRDARAAVRTDRDRDAEAKLEKMQEDLSDDRPTDCGGLHSRAAGADPRGKSGAQALAMSVSPKKTRSAVLACIDTEEKARRAEGSRLWAELCATAGVPAN